jgi:cytochrome c oxidase subunit 3
VTEPAAPTAGAGFQYSSARHEADTAVAGMWLFLASEMLFFGGVVFVWLVLHLGHPRGFALATAHTNLLIGSINTALLLTSSFVMALAVRDGQRGDNRAVTRACLLTLLLGLAFLGLKGLEWFLDFREHLFPGALFGLHGPDQGGAQMFYAWYFVSTALHGVHMLGGMGLVAWVAWRASRLEFSRHYSTPVEVVGLLWSFIDLVWLVLYPLIYLLARP